LLTGAAKENYTDHFPVHALRRLIDEPDPRGFDKDLQNLIIAVFAEEHQLAWRQHGAPVRVESVLAVSDQLELRKPAMPTEEAWLSARKRGSGIFGAPMPGWLSPSNVAAMAETVRREAKRWAPPVAALVTELERRAAPLGLDPAATTGRLATARQVAKLLADLQNETDDVVLIDLLGNVQLEVDDAAAGTVFKTADTITTALATTQWAVLEAVRVRATTDEQARAIVEQLERSARHDQNAADLVAALRTAVESATKLFVMPSAPTTPTSGGPGSGAAISGGPTAGMTTGGGSPVGLPPGGGAPHRRRITTATELTDVTRQIQAEIEAGRTVTVTWEAQ